MTTSARSPSRPALTLARVDLDRLARPALAVAVVAAAAIAYHLTRGTSVQSDEWNWIVNRRGNHLDTFLAPYNGHLSVVPILIYRLLFSAFGIGSYVPYRVVLIALTSLSGIVVFAYARGRVGEFCAALVAALVLFAAPGWQDTLWPFQVAWVIAVAAGVLALSLVELRVRAADVAACGLATVAVASTSVGVAFGVALAVDIAIRRRAWRDAWIPGIPLLLYVVWAVHYHPSTITVSAIPAVPVNFLQTTAAGLSGLVGLSGVTALDATGTAVTFGAPLLALAVILAARRALGGWRDPRALSLLVALIVFSALTTLARSFESPLTSRYMYVTCLIVALLVVELARGVRPTPGVQATLLVLAVAAIVANVGILRSGGAYYRQFGSDTDATLAAMQISRGEVAPSTRLTQLPLYPIVQVTAGEYFATARSLGTPADTIDQLQHADAGAQAAADAQLVSNGALTVAAAGRLPPPTAGAAPTVDGAANGVTTTAAGCLQFTPSAALGPGATGTLALTLGPGRYAILATRASVSVADRRFAPTFAALRTLAPGSAAVVTIRRDATAVPWQLQLSSISAVRACVTR